MAPVKRPDGTLVAQARIARTGVQTYRNADGTERREYRPPGSVFDKDSMASFRLVPITNDHPPEMITSQNARQYSVGAVGENIVQDGKWMVAPIVVHDAKTIADMQAGKTQCSNGYDCDLEMTAGVSPDGENYDCVQMNITGNHLAIVHNARAGADAAVRMDAAFSEDTDKQVTPENKRMDLAQALAALAATQEKLGAAVARADSAERERDASKALAAKLEGERDEQKSRADAAAKSHKDAMDARDGFVSARVELLAKCGAVLGAKLKRADGAEVAIASMADRDLKLALIKHVTDADCSLDSAGKPRTDEYINARYDGAIERASESKDTFRQAHDIVQIGRETADAGASKASKAYDEMVANNRTAWQNPAK